MIDLSESVAEWYIVWWGWWRWRVITDGRWGQGDATTSRPTQTLSATVCSR